MISGDEQSLWFWAAAAMSAVTFLVHTFVGGQRVAKPLLADVSLPKASKWLNYYCWHLVTITLAAMAIAFAAVALGRVGAEIGWMLGTLALLFSVLSVVVALKGAIHPLRFPSTTLFALIALAAAGAAMSGA